MAAGCQRLCRAIAIAGPRMGLRILPPTDTFLPVPPPHCGGVERIVAGHHEVAMQAKDAVAVYQSGNPAALANALDGLLASHALLARAKSAALEIARDCLCWERRERTLLAAIAATLVV